MSRLFRFVILTTLLFGFVRSAAFAKSAPPEKPNFIFIFCDNLGYGDVEPFGSTLHRTPHLNRMAKEGRKFTHYYVTAGVCTPSRSSIISGCYSQRVGMHDNPRDGQVLRPVSPYGLHPNELTIAEALQREGYATGMIGKWHLGDQPEFMPTKQGFEYFFGVPYSDDMTAAVGKRLGKRFQGDTWPPLPLMINEKVIESPPDRNMLTKRYTKATIDFITKNKEKPFFLYIPQAMPGSTRTPFASPQFKGKSKNGSWGDSIEELDWSTGQILDHLVKLKLDKNTLVIWTSDNGSPMLPKDGDFSRGSNRPLYGRGYTTAEGSFRMPTIAWWPGTVPAGSTCDQLVTTMDCLPTFVKLAGGEIPTKNKIDGYDIRPLLLGKKGAKTPYQVFYYYARRQLQAVRSGPWKLFVPLGSFERHPHFKKNKPNSPLLFNVETDIGSEHNVAAEHPEIVARLMVLAEEGREELGDVDRIGKGQRKPGYMDNPKPVVMKE